VREGRGGEEREGEDRRWKWKVVKLEREGKGEGGKERGVTTCCPISNELSPPADGALAHCM